MNREELVNSVIVSVGATTNTQITKVNSVLSDIVLAVELQQGYEILISELSAANIKIIKAECVRGYRA